MRPIRIIAVLVGKHVRILSRSQSTLMVMFLPGVVLYTIFTNIFSGPAGPARPFRVAVIDEDHSSTSKDFIDSLAATNMKIIRTENGEADGRPLTVDGARESIRKRGFYRVALVIPGGFGDSPNMLHKPEQHRGIIMYYDELEPVEAEIAGGLVQMAAGRQVFERMFGVGAGKSSSQADERVLVKVDKQSIRVRSIPSAAKHTFLAGIVPMFLLFSAAGAARALLEAVGSGEVRRFLAAPISASYILLGQMAYILLIQVVQCYVMYVYAWLVFGVAIWQITGGLFVLTLCTSLATTGFGMLLGALCKTAEQLDAVGTMVILGMSAVGGSMVPRHVMPEWMQKLGLLTINGWSFDGFMSVIAFEGWREMAMPCGVLLVVALASATVASVVLAGRLRGDAAR